MRSHFNRSALVRELASWLPAAVELPRQDLAERLGGWLNVADAIALHAAHQALPALAVARQRAAPKAAPDARAALERLRTTLTQAICTPPYPPTEPDHAEFAPHHQRCLDQQRRMEMGIDALRNHLRQTLAAASPSLAQLAALDAALDQMLGGREQRLLSGVPAFLKARFEHWRQAQPDAWPAHFEQDLQHALLAELDLRLQPLLGMVEALERH
ncbi:MAG: DUF3348 domain-containing protein [Hydrogenophaga sp.]|uniref:DUF3348 family protein n=1 Tax=Hydrogenophaga sp. TaxID=1904254 RepID=UPI0025BF6065|nr:DUF3348 family protein [Hydrogenophaga sp.]MBW0185258.1 DUF3348 domain-containing protein [Hydrogenophaga sp.]